MKEEVLYEARNKIAGFLLARRKELGMTQDELAEKAGLGVATIRRIESARFWMNVQQLLMLCHALDCFFFMEAKNADTAHAEKMREAMEQIKKFKDVDGQAN